MNKILKVLNNYFPWLPINVRLLKNTPRNVDVVDFGLGVSYFYVGITRALDYFLKKYNLFIYNNIEIDLGIDSLPVSKSSNSQMWPIMVNV